MVIKEQAITEQSLRENELELKSALDSVENIGLTLVWLFEYLKVRYYYKSKDKLYTGKSACKRSLPYIFHDFVENLGSFRNTFVHRGYTPSALYVMNITLCDCDIIEELFEIAEVPNNARNVFFMWYNKCYKE